MAIGADENTRGIHGRDDGTRVPRVLLGLNFVNNEDGARDSRWRRRKKRLDDEGMRESRGETGEFARLQGSIESCAR